MRRAAYFSAVLGFVVSGSLAAAEPVAPVGTARLDITPEQPIRLTGYANRKGEAVGVEDRLWAKALAIGADAAGQQPGPVVLVTVDNLAVPGPLRDGVARRLAEKCGIANERFSICSSHTHSGPALEQVAPLVFSDPPSAAEQAHIAAYTRTLADNIEAVALRALADRRPGRLAWSQGQAGFAVNRRLLESGHWVGFGVNPGGPVDHALPVLRVTDADGRLRGVLANYACHCTTLGPDFNKISADWSGYAQRFIERDHPGVMAMVAIGCAGDANPEPRGQLVQAIEHGEAMAREVNQLLAAPGEPLPTAITAQAETIELPLDKLPSRADWLERSRTSGAQAVHARAQLERLDRGEALPTSVPYRVQVWRFGDELTMVFLPGEVVVDYLLRLRREFTGRRLWVAAYANAVPCYIASKRLLEEGGYEVESSMYYYDVPTHFAPAVEDQIIAAIRRLSPADFRSER